MGLDPFHARLSSYRETTLARLLAAVPQREPQRYLYDPLTSYLSRTGKGIRPALCMATCRAFGGDASDALASAAAIEMLHNAFLVHDDIEDESELRRGLPTLHAEQGVPIALNAGDMMTALSVRILRENLPTLGQTLTVGSVRRVRTHDAGVARGPGDGAWLGARQPPRHYRRGLSADGPQEDMLVQLHPSLSYRRAHRHQGRRRPGSLQSLRILPRHGVPDSGRSSQSHGRRTALRERRLAEICSRGSAR